MVNLLKTFKPDMLYLVNLVSLGLVGLRYAHRLGLPVLASYHTDIPDFIEQWGFDLFINPIWTYLR